MKQTFKCTEVEGDQVTIELDAFDNEYTNVVVTEGTEVSTVCLSPQDARKMGLNLIRLAEQAEADA